uniref:Uncharacterized protein n=1 Tax=Glossina austeni TaxID=7395 RepID=A0A1A9URZ8_GLOAU
MIGERCENFIQTGQDFAPPIKLLAFARNIVSSYTSTKFVLRNLMNISITIFSFSCAALFISKIGLVETKSIQRGLAQLSMMTDYTIVNNSVLSQYRPMSLEEP